MTIFDKVFDIMATMMVAGTTIGMVVGIILYNRKEEH